MKKINVIVPLFILICAYTNNKFGEADAKHYQIWGYYKKPMPDLNNLSPLFKSFENLSADIVYSKNVTKLTVVSDYLEGKDLFCNQNYGQLYVCAIKISFTHRPTLDTTIVAVDFGDLENK